MKFVDIKGIQEVLSVEIIFPELIKDYEYFYPDGITRGIFKRETFFVMRSCFFDSDRLFHSPEEAIKGLENLSFIKEGRIWEKGLVSITLKSQPKERVGFRFTEEKELIDYLENLYSKGIDLSSLTCLETQELQSLYEFKDALRSKYL